GLWGLCRRCLARGLYPAGPKAGCQGAAVAEDGGCGRCGCLAGGLVRPAPGATALPGTVAVAIRRNTPAGAWSARRSIGLRVVAAGAGPWVVFPKEDRQGGRRHCRG